MTRADRAAILRRIRQARRVSAAAQAMQLVSDELLADVQRLLEELRVERRPKAEAPNP